ncbi:piggyBac transposable element-derived protein 3-like [Schistocerca nitens]|uniref:piggyBac transposable element-derived protein 3-like n=1 Tax=Schistocerca nitens TaxID=7011 RepID=UPI002117A96D|nr:piggyBac transposable element-derived protein 3-like [Schistocerca nitens]
MIRGDDETKFAGNTALPQEVLELDTPVEYFQYFFTKDIVQYIVQQSNLYSIQCRHNKYVNVSAGEIEQFIGTALFMSVIQLPATRHYWCKYLGHPVVSDIISCNRWEEIKHFIHFCDNSNLVPAGEPNHGELFKIRPLLDQLRERLLRVPKEEFLAVDEQIIPTKCRSSLKQYNPSKPHKWGFKAFVLSGVSGFSYDYESFAGAQSNIIIPGAMDLGASSNVVVRLTQTVPRHVNHKLFFDNWFTSVPLEVYLHKEGIQSLGTVRSNRVRGCILPKEAAMKKNGQGSMEEKIATVDGVQLSVVSWFDNKVVNTLSTYVGCKPEGEIKRLFRKEKEHKMVPCPHSVMIYNDYIGGVDLLDSMLGYYRIQIRSKKWYLNIFFHLVDLACVNSWLLWRRRNMDYMPLVDFKVAVAEALCKTGKSLSKKRGRPSNELQKQLDCNKKRGPTADLPQRQVRLDGIDHMPIGWKTVVVASIQNARENPI